MLSEQDRRYLISDQDWDVRRPLDLLQAWGPPAREPLRVRLGRILGAMRQRHLPRTICAVGAVFDSLTVIPMLFPRIGGLVFGIREFTPGSDYRYAMYTAASLMLGWSGLLIWTFVNPIERRGVLLLTGVPVIVGLMAAGIYAVTANFIRLTWMLPTLIIQAVLLCLFLVSYHIARAAAEPAAEKSARTGEIPRGDTLGSHV